MPDTENELQSEQSDKIPQFFRPWVLGILYIFLKILYPADIAGIPPPFFISAIMLFYKILILWNSSQKKLYI